MTNFQIPIFLENMPFNLKADLETLSRLAFNWSEQARDLVREFCTLSESSKRHPDFHLVDEFYPWLLTPLTVWPIDLDGLGRHLLRQVNAGRRIESASKLLLAQLGPPPPTFTQEAVAIQEHDVKAGNYERFINQQVKFDMIEKELTHNEAFLEAWNAIKLQFDVEEYRNYRGIIRRRMVQERNFRTSLKFSWNRKRERFQEVFDVFCHRWSLWGMVHDNPMLLKLSVNLTPFGTMIVVPNYWSFDAKRDLNWKAINALHRIRGIRRQGAKLSEIKQANRVEAKRAKAFWVEAESIGLRGGKRVEWVMSKLGWHPGTDESRLKRLLRETRRKGERRDPI